MRKAWSWGAALTLSLMGCGGLLGKDSGGEPLVLLEGELAAAGQGVVVSGDRLRATLVWQRYSDTTAQCAELGELDCALEASNSPQFSVELEDVPVGDGFPQVFRMPLYAPPAAEALNVLGKARLGLASVLAYDDRNANGRLDPVAPEDVVSTDHVVGYQGKESEQELHLLYVVFRDGPLHPLYGALYPGCPEPPQGYSVLRDRMLRIAGTNSYASDSCTLETGTVTLPMHLPSGGADDLACASSHGLNFLRLEPPPASAPDSATTTSRCWGSRRTILAVNQHPERICTAPNMVFYALYAPAYGDWDLRSAPPAWWPCEVPPSP